MENDPAFRVAPVLFDDDEATDTSREEFDDDDDEDDVVVSEESGSESENGEEEEADNGAQDNVDPARERVFSWIRELRDSLFEPDLDNLLLLKNNDDRVVGDVAYRPKDGDYANLKNFIESVSYTDIPADQIYSYPIVVWMPNNCGFYVVDTDCVYPRPCDHIVIASSGAVYSRVEFFIQARALEPIVSMFIPDQRDDSQPSGGCNEGCDWVLERMTSRASEEMILVGDGPLSCTSDSFSLTM
jgi:hypothetical protein